MADRYTYLPYIGLALSVLLLIDQWAAKNKSLGYAAWALVGVATLFWTMQTPKQIEVWQNSETLWTTAERFYPGDGQILANLGNYYGKSGNLDKAQSCFERAIKSNIRNAAVYEGLGNVYGSKNDHRKAAEMFAEAINIDPRKGNYYFNRGTAYSNFDPAKGIEDLDKALSLMPPAKKNDVLSRRGFCYFQLKDYPKAIADYSTVIASGGAGASVYFDRGVAKLNMNDTPAAIADFEGALQVDPNFALAKNALGQLRK
jgi:protein O-mannosyl-transferase